VRANKLIKVLMPSRGDLAIKILKRGLIQGLEKEGFRVETACSNEHCTEELRKEGYIIHTINLKKTASLLVAFVYSVWYFLKLYLLIKKNRYQVVHSYTPIVGLIGSLAARLARVPIVIYSLQGFYFEGKKHNITWRIHYLLEMLTLKLASYVFFASKEDYALVLSKGIIPAEKCLYTANGVDIERFADNSTGVILQNTLGLEGHKVVVTVARLVWEKGYKELLESIKIVSQKVPKIKLIIAGDGGDRCQIHAKAKELNLDQYITFLGAIDNVHELLALANVFVLPSYREGLPYSIIEAMMVGKAVITTDIRGCRELVENNETGLLVPDRDSYALAEAILELIRDDARARKMGQRGRKKAICLYDERTVVAKQVKKYQELLALI